MTCISPTYGSSSCQLRMSLVYPASTHSKAFLDYTLKTYVTAPVLGLQLSSRSVVALHGGGRRVYPKSGVAVPRPSFSMERPLFLLYILCLLLLVP